MKAWKNTGRVGIGMDFAHGEAARRMGQAAIEGRTYLQLDIGFGGAGINSWPIRLKLHTGLQVGERGLEGLLAGRGKLPA